MVLSTMMYPQKLRKPLQEAPWFLLSNRYQASAPISSYQKKYLQDEQSQEIEVGHSLKLLVQVQREEVALVSTMTNKKEDIGIFGQLKARLQFVIRLVVTVRHDLIVRPQGTMGVHTMSTHLGTSKTGGGGGSPPSFFFFFFFFFFFLFFLHPLLCLASPALPRTNLPDQSKRGDRVSL
ncbi:hypothetical protein EYF80_010823 [Liparis tanakae]|uniref:Uncharacterized protein n=1 Tax=Liparis tanakae TaxID=230148 RepID=A0A4Z2IMA4_9TELE|nr:hypothetical protein EYF80_010823 [Liparis tanakae]